MRYERIVVPLDGSELSQRALAYATGMARALDAGIELLRVVEPMVPIPMDAPPGAGLALLTEDLRPEYTQYLDAMAAGLRESGVRVSSTVRDGIPAQRIAGMGAGAPDTIIVMSTHGRSGMTRWLLGSVADKVVRSGETPVLLVRSAMRGSPGEGPPFRALIVPLDGSQVAESALPIATTLARSMAIPVTLVRCTGSPWEERGLLEDSGPPAHEMFEEADAQARGYLGEVRSQLEAGGLGKVEVRISHSRPAEGVLEIGSELKSPLVVMATHGRTGLGRWILGSVTDRVVRHSAVPVLVVPGSREGTETSQG